MLQKINSIIRYWFFFNFTMLLFHKTWYFLWNYFSLLKLFIKVEHKEKVLRRGRTFYYMLLKKRNKLFLLCLYRIHNDLKLPTTLYNIMVCNKVLSINRTRRDTLTSVLCFTALYILFSNKKIMHFPNHKLK